jgi:anti-sigma factor NepR-like protein
MSGRSDNVVRLGCAEQAAIADELRRYWQHVVDEGVPENLRALILRFETSDEDAEPGAADDRVAQVDCENPA